jgi:branched-chain amino acid transport system substrate-binding protein
MKTKNKNKTSAFFAGLALLTIVLTITMVLTMITLTACTPKDSNSRIAGKAVPIDSTYSVEKTKIGVIAPLTGNAAELGQHIQRGLEIANKNLGYKYDIIYEDDACTDTKAALSAAQKLATIDKVNLVIGPLCAPAYQATSAFFNQNKIGFMHTSGVTPSFIASSGEFGIPGISTTIHEEDKVLAEFIFNSLNIKKMGIFVWNEEWALEHRNGFVKSYEALGGNIVFDERFLISDNNFKTSILKLKESGAEGVFVVALNFQNADIVKQIRELDNDNKDKIKIFGQFEIEDPAFLGSAGTAAQGLFYVYPKIDFSDAEVEEFISNHRIKYGSEPNYYSYVGYDSLKLYDYAINRCKEHGKSKSDSESYDSNCVIQTVLSSKDFPGVSRKITFNQDKTILRDFVIKRI